MSRDVFFRLFLMAARWGFILFDATGLQEPTEVLLCSCRSSWERSAPILVWINFVKSSHMRWVWVWKAFWMPQLSQESSGQLQTWRPDSRSPWKSFDFIQTLGDVLFVDDGGPALRLESFRWIGSWTFLQLMVTAEWSRVFVQSRSFSRRGSSRGADSRARGLGLGYPLDLDPIELPLSLKFVFPDMGTEGGSLTFLSSSREDRLTWTNRWSLKNNLGFC